MNRSELALFRVRRSNRRGEFSESLSSDLDLGLPNPSEWQLGQLLKKNTSLFTLSEQRKSSDFTLKKNISGPDLSLRVLNASVRSQVAAAEEFAPSLPSRAQKRHKISVTAETRNYDFNRQILIGQLRRKLPVNEENYLSLKKLAGEFIRSFKCLSGFRHQNIFLNDIKDSITSLTNSVILLNEQLKPQTERIEYKEQHKEQYFDLVTEVKKRKELIESLRVQIKQQNQAMNEKARKTERMLEELAQKELSLNHDRKLGRVSASEVYKILVDFRARVDDEVRKLDQLLSYGRIETQKNQETIRHTEDEIQTLNFNKLLFRMKLKQHYTEFFRSEDLFVTSGLTAPSVLALMWNFKENVPDSAFSSFFDAEDIRFVKEYAELSNRIEEERKHNSYRITQFREAIDIVGRTLNSETEEEKLNEIKMTLRSLKLRKKFPQTPSARPRRIAVVSSDKLVKQLLAKMASSLRDLKDRQINRILAKGKEITRMKGAGVSTDFVKKAMTVFFGIQEAESLFNRLLHANKISFFVSELGDGPFPG